MDLITDYNNNVCNQHINPEFANRSTREFRSAVLAAAAWLAAAGGAAARRRRAAASAATATSSTRRGTPDGGEAGHQTRHFLINTVRRSGAVRRLPPGGGQVRREPDNYAGYSNHRPDLRTSRRPC